MQASPTRLIAALVAVAAFVLAACGGSPQTSPDSSIASLADDQTAAAQADAAEGDETDEPEPLAPEDAELAFAAYDECMKEAGFDFGTSLGGDLVDSETFGDAEGATVQEFEVEAGGDPQSGGLDALDFGEEFQAADEECSTHLEGLDLGFDMSPEEEAAFEDAQIEWAECMRERGIDVPDFDGNASAGVVIVGGPEEEGDPQSGGFGADDFDFEAFEEANQECGAAFDELEERFGDEDRS